MESKLWLIVVAISVGFEIIGNKKFTFIWFALSGLIAYTVSLLHISVYIQIILFIAIGFATKSKLRDALLDRLYNPDLDVDIAQKYIAKKFILNVDAVQGLSHYEYWLGNVVSVTTDESFIGKGILVVVTDIRKNKLVVEPVFKIM